MTWTKIDDQFYSHPKVGALDLALMPAAVGLHVLALSWCANQLTDGKVPRPQVVRLIGDPIAYALADELVRVGLWEVAESGYVIHDYLEYNPTREKVIAEREAARARMQRFRGSSGEVQANTGRSSTTPVPVPVPKTLRSKDLSKPAPKPPAPSDEFDSFWSIYPRKEAKGAAVRAYKAALKKAKPATIREALEAQLPELCMRERQFVPLPATWLNAERWADDLAGQDTHVQRVTRLRQLRKEHGDERVRAMCDDERLWQEVVGGA